MLGGDGGGSIAPTCTFIQGDARQLPLADKSVQCCITSPPYWSLRAYQGVSPTLWEGDPSCTHQWSPLGSQAVHGAPIASSLAMVKLLKVDRGKMCLKCGGWEGCLGNEPVVEQYIDHLVEIFNEVKRVLRDDGLCFLNIGDCYDSKSKQRWLVPHRLALALQDAGWIVRSDIIWAKGISFCKTYAGSVMPESTRDRPTCSHEHILMLAKSKRYFYDYEAVREEGTIAGGTRAAKGSGTREGNRRPTEYTIYDGKRNPRDVWAINTRPYRGAHFATFPPALVLPLIRAGSSVAACGSCGTPFTHRVQRSPVPDAIHQQLELARARSATVTGRTDGFTNYKPSKNYQRAILSDGYVPGCGCAALPLEKPVHHLCTILDPFAGSGTVGVVARQVGRDFIGIDASAEYIALAQARLAAHECAATTDPGHAV